MKILKELKKIMGLPDYDERLRELNKLGKKLGVSVTRTINDGDRRTDEEVMIERIHKAVPLHEGKQKIPIVIILTLLGMCSGFYAYQYHYIPEINITNIEAQYVRETKTSDMRINFSFKIKNTGKSKTKRLTLFSVFPKWITQETSIMVIPYDFIESEVQNLAENEETTLLIYKDINLDDFIKNHNMADGIWLNLVLRWDGDNLAYFGRTFEKHILVFLKQGIKDNKMVFLAQQVEERDLSLWFLKKDKRPNIFKTLEDLKAANLLYGVTSRFD